MALKGVFWSYEADGREFSIRRRDLPQPWHNYISTDHIRLILKHTGAGPSFGRSPTDDRFTAEDNPRLVFLRDRHNGAFWTVNGVDGDAPADWECRHGFGYTILRGTRHGIHGTLTIFVPLDVSAEVWRVSLRNLSQQRRRLSVFSFVLWQLAHARHGIHYDCVYFERNLIFAECWHWAFADFRNSYPRYNRTWDRVAFMGMSLPVSGFDCTRAGFLGEPEGLFAPAAVRQGRCRNSERRGEPSCGALQGELDLAPGAEAEFVVVVGAAADKAAARGIAAKIGAPAKAARAFDALRAWWDEYLARMTIRTPDPDITTFANGWNRYAMLQRYYHRFGYRDTTQDIAAFCPIDPERVRQRIGQLCEAQFRAGNTYHDVAQLGFPQHVTINSDPPAWLPWVVGIYARETGDLEWLRTRFAYADGGAGTVYEHCVRAATWYRGEIARYGLPRIRSGDWNDCLQGSWRRGVSVWLAEFLTLGLRDLAAIAACLGRAADARRFRVEAARLTRAVNARAWDGRWYVRAFDDDGRPIGSGHDREGRIFLESQVWAVLSGVAPSERARECMRSVQRLMDLPVGLPLVAPPFTRIEEQVGLISRMAPGVHHNGGSWNHAVTWAIIAECRIGRPDRALELYRRIFPAYLSQRWQDHRSEPYIHASYTDAPASGHPGRTGVGFNTGTVCWIYRALHEGFAGITAGWDGLRIAPSLPREWDWLEVRRRYRDNEFHIVIEASRQGRRDRIIRFEVDGRPRHTNVVPARPDRQTREVRVILG